MHFLAALTLGCVCGLLARETLAVTGAPLYLNGNDVLIRSGAGPEHAVIMSLDRGQQLTELERRGQWIRVRIERPGDPEGWVHTFFTQNTPVMPLSELQQDDPLATFRRDVEEFNGAALRLSGATFFTRVQSVGASAVELQASENWLSLRPAERDRMLEQLFRLWSGYTSGDGQIAVYVVDPRGQRVMERKSR